MQLRLTICTALVATLLGTSAAAAQEILEAGLSTEYQTIRLVRLADATRPWAVAPLADGRVLFTERRGRVFVIANGTRTEVSGAPAVHAQNQGGLLDAVPHPDYARNGWIYFTYSKGNSDSTTTALGRARLDGTRLVGFEELFVSNAWGRPGGHYGSRVVFLHDGTLLMSIGDRMREPQRAQNPRDHAGSILRLNADGSVPHDNPFAGRGDTHAAEIWSYGHRNIQGMALHPATGVVWVMEHGPRGSDLLHRITPGENYGWPDATRGRDYRTQQPFPDAGEPDPSVVPPVHEFVITVAPSGMTAVVGGGWHETWQGNLLAGGLRSQRVIRLVTENDELVHAEELLLQRIGRIRDVRQGADGHIYIATDETDGGIYRIEPVERSGS